jgi:putative transposase
MQTHEVIIKRERDLRIFIDETLIKAGSEYIVLWVAIEAKNRQTFALF